MLTTAEELDGFNIVRAIAVSDVAPERISYRDGKAYFAVILDNNNRKPIIRLHLNGKTVKFVTTFENGNSLRPWREVVVAVVLLLAVVAQPVFAVLTARGDCHLTVTSAASVRSVAEPSACKRCDRLNRHWPDGRTDTIRLAPTEVGGSCFY